MAENALLTKAVETVDPLKDGRTKVRRYPLPPEGDLLAHLRLLESFERRFLHAAEGGSACIRHISTGDMAEYVETLRQEYASCGDEAQKRHLGGQLGVALMDMGLQHAKLHIRMRMEGHNDDAVLEGLKQKAQGMLMEGVDFVPLLHRRDGTPDVDDVLNEMKGEPYKIFVATLPGASGVLNLFRMNREQKAALAIRYMERTADAMQALVRQYPQLAQDDAANKVQALMDAARERVQVPFDNSDFKQAHADMARARKALSELAHPVQKPLPGRLPMDHGPVRCAPTPKALQLLQRGADLIFDMAVVRGARTVSTKQYEQDVQGFLPPPLSWAKRA